MTFGLSDQEFSKTECVTRDSTVTVIICFVLLSSREKLQFSYCQGLSTKPFLGETIGQKLDKTVEKFPDREAYVFCEDNKRATFAKFQEEVGKYDL